MSFLISSQRTFERDALSEAYYVISDVLGYKVHPLKSRVPGLAILRLSEEEDTYRIIDEIRQYIQKKGPLVACLKIVPLERLMRTDLPKIVENVISLAKIKILPTNSWKIHVRKRQTNLKTSQIVEKVAEKINWGNVNLTTPDLEIRIEIVRDLTGISILHPQAVLSMAKLINDKT
ncbi:MAG: THUMP domain-containing protein [Promethearchaeota archaeon]